MKRLSMMVLVCIGTFLFALPVFAHVTVQPSVSTPGAWETYTIKVPVEKEQATIKVVLKIPEGATFSSYEPVEGWKTTLGKNKEGEVNTVTWEATGEGILVGQFQRFSFVASNPDKDGELAWDAYQYYADGSIVEWTGDEGAETPHSITKIMSDNSETAASDATDEHNSLQEDTKEKEVEEKGSGMETAALIVSIFAILISIIAITTSFRRNK